MSRRPRPHYDRRIDEIGVTSRRSDSLLRAPSYDAERAERFGLLRHQLREEVALDALYRRAYQHAYQSRRRADLREDKEADWPSTGIATGCAHMVNAFQRGGLEQLGFANLQSASHSSAMPDHRVATQELS